LGWSISLSLKIISVHERLTMAEFNFQLEIVQKAPDKNKISDGINKLYKISTWSYGQEKEGLISSDRGGEIENPCYYDDHRSLQMTA